MVSINRVRMCVCVYSSLIILTNITSIDTSRVQTNEFCWKIWNRFNHDAYKLCGSGVHKHTPINPFNVSKWFNNFYWIVWIRVFVSICKHLFCEWKREKKLYFHRFPLPQLTDSRVESIRRPLLHCLISYVRFECTPFDSEPHTLILVRAIRQPTSTFIRFTTLMMTTRIWFVECTAYGNST